VTAGQRRVLALLTDLAAGRATATPNGPCEGLDADEPERTTDTQADRRLRTRCRLRRRRDVQL